MTIRQAVQLFVLALAGATLAGCVQHTAEQSASRGVSPQEFSEAAPQRRASVAHHRRVAAAPSKHVPFAAKPATTKLAALTNSSVGIASFYKYESRTASGEQFNPRELTAAHRTLPFGSQVTVINPRNGNSITVVINDRGPFVKGVTLDLARGAARAIGMKDTQWVCMSVAGR